MHRTIQQLVWRRARRRCEYCHLPKNSTSILFEIDHIIAEQHGGETISANLALACYSCNHHKGPNLSGVDPRTHKPTWLFHPRKDRWGDHFRWEGPLLLGLTPLGRTTIKVLAINQPIRISQRAVLMDEGLFHVP